MKHRMIGSDRVEFGSGREPALPEARRERVANDDPCPFLLSLHTLFDIGLDVIKRAIGRDRVILFARRRPERVDVAVVEAGQQGFAPGVDLFRHRPRQGVDLGVGPDGHDPVSLEGHRLGDPVVAIDGDDLGVANDRVRFVVVCRSRRHPRGESQDRTEN